MVRIRPTKAEKPFVYQKSPVIPIFGKYQLSTEHDSGKNTQAYLNLDILRRTTLIKLIILSGAVLLTGCASVSHDKHPYTITEDSKHASYYDGGAPIQNYLDKSDTDESDTIWPVYNQVHNLYEGETLREALDRWVKQSDFNYLVWHVKDEDGDIIEIPLSSSHAFKGSLEESLAQLKRAYATSPINPLFLEFTIKQGNKSLIVINQASR